MIFPWVPKYLAAALCLIYYVSLLSLSRFSFFFLPHAYWCALCDRIFPYDPDACFLLFISQCIILPQDVLWLAAVIYCSKSEEQTVNIFHVYKCYFSTGITVTLFLKVQTEDKNGKCVTRSEEGARIMEQKSTGVFCRICLL